jgi:phospholipid-binding lipoprotein MlaA
VNRQRSITPPSNIGDYEAIKGAAIDAYIAMRDAYIQYRKKVLEE